MKRVFLAVLVWLLLAAPTSVLAQFSWSTNGDAIYITGYDGPGGTVNIPSTINGLPVVGFAEYAFNDDTNITSMTIPGSITNFGYLGFSGCSRLTNILISNGVTSITWFAFCDCYGLVSVTIPDSVTNIAEYAFGDCYNLASVTIPGSVTSIGPSAFDTCRRLTNVVLSDGVTSVGEIAFEYCYSLAQVTMADSVTNIGIEAFQYCTSLTSLTIPSGLTSLAGGLFTSCTSLTNIEIPGSVTNIGSGTFSSCTNLVNITIPASVNSIWPYAFDDCPALNAVLFLGNAPIDEFAFYGDTAIVYYLPGATGWYSYFSGLPTVEEALLLYATNAGAITITGCAGSGAAVTIPATLNGLPVTSIGADAFAGLTNLTNITIAASVTNIGSNAFAGCSNLTNFYFEGNAPALGMDVFLSDSNAVIYYIAGASGWSSSFSGLPTVEEVQLFYTTNYGTITITGCSASGIAAIIPPFINGRSVTHIGYGAFYEQTNLVTAEILGTVGGIGEDAFSGCSSLTKVNIPDGVNTLGDFAFYECRSLTTVTIPGSLFNFGSQVFGSCVSLTNITLVNGVSTIGPDAFFDCASLTNLCIPETVTSIGFSAFNDCTRLRAVTVDPGNMYYSSINGVLFDKGQDTILFYPQGLVGGYTIPGSVQTIGQFAFFDCYNLTSVQFPPNLYSIGVGAFVSCAGLTNMMLGSYVNDIEDQAFYDCTNLTAITVNPQNDTYSSVGGVLFDKSQTTLLQYPAGLKGSYTIPDGVSIIAGQAFSFCAGLTGVRIPNSVTSIEGGAFQDCEGLKRVTIPAGVNSIQDWTFAYCSLTNVTILGNVNTIEPYAFYDCANLASLYFKGDAPVIDSTSFTGDDFATFYYVPGATGWSSPYDGLPAVLWNPLIQGGSFTFGAAHNQFGFLITGTPNISLVVDACTNLASPVWTPIGSLKLFNGSWYFVDPLPSSSAGRFYCISSP